MHLLKLFDCLNNFLVLFLQSDHEGKYRLFFYQKQLCRTASNLYSYRLLILHFVFKLVLFLPSRYVELHNMTGDEKFR